MTMFEEETAKLLLKLARKNNWNNSYDRTEHFKWFPNLDKIIKELSKLGWLILHKKPSYLGISLTTRYKEEIFKFIKKYLPHTREMLK